MRGCQPPGGLWALLLGEAPCRFGTLRRAVRRCGCRAGMGEEMPAVCTNDSADRELAAGHGLLRHDARRENGYQGHRPKRGVGINRRRTAKRR